MNRLSVFIYFLMSVLISSADEYIESFNIISENYDGNVQNVQIIRPINGGTVIIPIFDDSCPEELKAPFSYACKIVEEYMPTCLPLKVSVSCGRINSSTGHPISKVLSLSKENFGNSIHYNNAQMSVIKGVILAELCHNSSITYLDSVPNVEFLTGKPDINITYNNQYLDEISFSLEPEPEQKYDFVSLAIRDLLIGLGLSHSYRYNPLNNGLQNPSQEFTPFEKYIDGLLGNYGNPTLRLNQATKGELIIKKNMTNGQDLKLYAPAPWKDKTSLNYFIPLEGCCISSILSYNFCKGQVTRSLSDEHSNFIFEKLLGWRPDYTVSSDSPESSIAGSTSFLMPYNGFLSFDRQAGLTYSFNESNQPMRINDYISTDNEDLNQYLATYDPLYSLRNTDEGHSVSILMKDGSWDIVESDGDPMDGVALSMSNWNFNFESNQYARTVDGYLRAKLITKKIIGTKRICKSTYFVVDYLPQSVSLNYSFIPISSTSSAISNTNNNNNLVRIYFSDTEGIDRIVLERLRQGIRVPSKIEITDYRKGYYDTTIDRATTFTAVGYNANGVSRSIPITITPTYNTLSVNLSLDHQHIYVQPLGDKTFAYQYEIMSLPSSKSLQTKYTGTTTGNIDISTLPHGMYVVTVYDNNSTVLGSLKFKI